jgi:peptidoglycan-associated lipoprotein
MHRHPLVFTALMAATMAVGCARTSADRVPAVPASESAPAQAEMPAPVEHPYHVTGVSLDPQLMSSCKIAGVQTFFTFDSEEVDPPKDTVLYQVAQCLTDGPLKGRKVRVVGHTDPRGSDRYNDELGRSRAESVREYLVFHGVGPDTVEFLSMGEAGADESSPAEWPYDRRVDIHLAP